MLFHFPESSDQWEPLFFDAIQNGKLDLAQSLCHETFQSISNIHANDELFFRTACFNGDVDMVRFLTTSADLLNAGHSFVNIHIKDEYTFQWLCRFGDLNLVEFLSSSQELLDAGHTLVNIHACNELAFRWACEKGHLDIVKFLTTSSKLLDSGQTFVDIHAEGGDALLRAIENAQWNVAQFLIFDLNFSPPPILESKLHHYPLIQDYLNIRDEQRQLKKTITPILNNPFPPPLRI